jgi:hypothetical protein
MTIVGFDVGGWFERQAREVDAGDDASHDFAQIVVDDRNQNRQQILNVARILQHALHAVLGKVAHEVAKIESSHLFWGRIDQFIREVSRRGTASSQAPSPRRATLAVETEMPLFGSCRAF